MAADSKAGHNSVIGKITIEIQDDFQLRLSVYGAMNDPAFLEMVYGYLRQYIDRRWCDVWEKEEG